MLVMWRVSTVLNLKHLGHLINAYFIFEGAGGKENQTT